MLFGLCLRGEEGQRNVAICKRMSPEQQAPQSSDGHLSHFHCTCTFNALIFFSELFSGIGIL